MREWLGGMFAAGYLDYDAQQPAARVADVDRGTRAGADRLGPRFPSLTAIGYDVHPQGHLRPG